MADDTNALAGQQGEARPAREGLSERAFDGVSAWLRANSFVVDMAQMATMVSLAEHLLSSAAPDNNAPAPMALSSEAQAEPADDDWMLVAYQRGRLDERAAASGERDTLRALLREARGPLSERDMYEELVGRIDAALADGGAK